MIEPTPPIDDDEWELYGPDDWTQARNIANDNPTKLAEDSNRLFLIEAAKYNVLPLDDRRIGSNADLAGRPQLRQGKLADLFFEGMGGLFGELSRRDQEQVALRDRQHHRARPLAETRVSVADGEEILSGWGRFHFKRRQTQVLVRDAGTHAVDDRRRPSIDPGDHQVRIGLRLDGGGLAKGGTVTLYLDGDKVGEGRVEATVPMVFSGDETTDVGKDTGTGVSTDYATGDNSFTGRVHWVQIDIDDKAEDLDHLITPEERLRVTMARQ